MGRGGIDPQEPVGVFALHPFNKASESIIRRILAASRQTLRALSPFYVLALFQRLC